MNKYGAPLIALTLMLGVGAACTGNPASPTAPSATTGGTTAASHDDGSPLKVSAPALVAPVDNDRVDTRNPTLVWLNAHGDHATIGFAYELVVVDSSDNEVYARPLGESTGYGTHRIELQLPYDTTFHWRIRAVLEGQPGPWSIWAAFRTPLPPPPPTTPVPTTGTVGPARTMAFEEAYAIIKGIHATGLFNLGASSSRDFRVAFLFGAVAAVHYGHARWNPQGPDSNWCVKDAGAGRPPSDDVLVRCNTRDAWDLISGVGGNGYNFHPDYLGKLGSSHNVYPPGRNALGILPQ